MKKREELIEEINNFDRRDINKPEYSIIKEIQFSIPVYDNPCVEEDFSSYVLEWDEDLNDLVFVNRYRHLERLLKDQMIEKIRNFKGFIDVYRESKEVYL